MPDWVACYWPTVRLTGLLVVCLIDFQSDLVGGLLVVLPACRVKFTSKMDKMEKRKIETLMTQMDLNTI